VVSFGLCGFLGAIGADRFYVGDILLGIFKLITLGGFGLWVLIDLIIIAGTTRDKNIQLARELKHSFQQTNS
jgi:TM2 domain-containing membrane protein YozV